MKVFAANELSMIDAATDETVRVPIEVSIVVPVYRSAATLAELVSRLHAAAENWHGPTEVVLVDDGSPDDSWSVLLQLKSEYPQFLKIVRLAKNSGQHNALLCGIKYAAGRVVVTMDDDLQHPPEEVPKLLAALHEPLDMVIGAYDFKRHAGARNLAGGIVDRFIRHNFGLPPDFQLTSFRAVRRDVAMNAANMGGVYPYLTAMLLTHSSRCSNVTVRHDARRIGQSNYNLTKSLLLLANLVFSYSSLPIFVVALCCFVAFACAGGYGALVFWRAMTLGTGVPGWASTIVVLTTFQGMTLLSLAIFGIYLARISRQLSRASVPFTVREVHE